MNDHQVNEHSPSPEADLYTKALAVTNDPEWCRDLCRALLYRASWSAISEALLSIEKLRARETLTGHPLATRLAELEMERARFVDPDRSGE